MSINVATLRQVPSRSIEGTDIRFVKVAERKFFGFISYKVYGRDAAISTPAKTVVDCIDRPDLVGGSAELARIVYGAMSEVAPGELTDAALRMKSTAPVQRLGFLTDLVGQKLPDEFRTRLRAAIPKSTRSVFGRPERRQDDIGYVSDWGAFVNATTTDLLTDVPRILRDRAS